MPKFTPNISCVSLGMVIIDEIHMPHREPLLEVIGGSATFVTLGQRLFARDSSEVGCLVIAGDDFPSSVKRIIEHWGTTTVFKPREGKPSSRGKLVYRDDTFSGKYPRSKAKYMGANDSKAKTFEYTQPPLRASPSDLVSTPLLHAKAFHLFGTPTEILTQVPNLMHLRERTGIRERPLIVWEPLPASCTRQHYEDFLAACKLADIFSPNHLELAALFGRTLCEQFDRQESEQWGQMIVDAGVGSNGDGMVITRAGEHGSLIMSRDSRPIWLPAYYGNGSPKVIDPTGAGNAFLGGYIAGWQHHGNVVEAVYHGHVAASFALEQIGLPEVNMAGAEVVCNGIEVHNRLEEYKRNFCEVEIRSERVL
ncbi:hypothetical protein N0V90_009461 [Kalmusia sp. IMI 367209]|nr:hypothetical protein N0V90_009461 [Kalmusia sp. IMI 367209]